MKVYMLMGITSYGDIILNNRFAYLRPNGRKSFYLELYEYDQGELAENIYPEFTRIVKEGLGILLMHELENGIDYMTRGPLIRLFDGYVPKRPESPWIGVSGAVRIGEIKEEIEIDVSLDNANNVTVNGRKVATLGWNGRLSWPIKAGHWANIRLILYDIIQHAMDAGQFFGASTRWPIQFRAIERVK